VEASLIRGKGELIITGQIGEVMQESARAALSYARSFLDREGIKPNLFENLDIHIHVPAGAIPKDGPSAGTAMAAALISAVTQRPVDKDVAMTGEITLRGRVLPIGGLKEKALGGLRAGIKTVLIPMKNKKELAEIPAVIKRKLNFIPVQNMDEVIEKSLLPSVAKKRVSKTKAASRAKSTRKN
ncbi:MAG: endopeptidase La, partial [Desulfatitalea sp.]|nr:endopeptidase La [Desulfatitalea sp.]NNJ99021.1 endopeptidase La [Desulfatitalea sp.]